MKPNTPIDVADFFKQQLEHKEITPPEEIWDKVSSQIPTYSTSIFSNQWWIYNSIVAIIVVSAVVFFWLNNTKPEISSGKALQVDRHQGDISIKKTIAPEKNLVAKQDAKVAEEKKSAVVIQPTTVSQLKQTVYYIEASTIGLLEKIEISDTLYTIKKVIYNPLPNDYGFYELNIQELKPGSYFINFYRKDGKKIQRKELFR
ncbi:MAG: hypothetical protein N2449_07590 [Bacteroidales bacterium]|nr:hypothetical protein [Bacteroidales bacterium]